MKKFEVIIKSELCLEVEAESTEQAERIASESDWSDLVWEGYISDVEEV